MDSRPLCPSHMPPRTDHFEDEESSSLSDYDSEWTQVSGAEDDSDCPPLTAASDRPLSRADTFDGSLDGEVWEGFIDGVHRTFSRSSDQTGPPVVEADATDEMSQNADPQLPNLSAIPQTEDHETMGDLLDSELVGTLRASSVRSASSLHTSLTESQSKLRLSFPDPLSSREHLDIGAVAQAVSPSGFTEEGCENPLEDSLPVIEDTQAPLTLPASESLEEVKPAVLSIPSSSLCILTLSLYGSASSSKWQIAERVMKLVLQCTDDARSIIEDGSSRDYYFDRSSCFNDTVKAVNEPSLFVRVFDRTSSGSEKDNDDHLPSVAILLLPSRLPAVLPRHKFYLPLICTTSLDFGSRSPTISSTFSEQVMVDSARYAWRKLDLPIEDIVILDAQRPHAILDATALESADQAVLVQAFSVVLNNTKQERSLRVHERVQPPANKWYTLALIVTVLIAFTAGGIQVRRNSSSTDVVANSTSGGVSDGPISVLHSVRTDTTFVAPPSYPVPPTHSYFRSLSTVVATTNALRRSDPPDRVSERSKLSDVAQDGVSSVSASSATGSSSPEPSTCRSKARSWVDRFNLSLGEYIPRDLIVWPVDHLGIVGKKPALRPRPVRGQAGDKTAGNVVKSISLRTVQNSLAVVSSKGKALKKMAEKDLSVLYEAIDELLRTLSEQVNAAKGEMKGAKSVAQSSFSVRNSRAKENARRLRRVGENLVRAAGDHLRTKGEEALITARRSRYSRRIKERRVGNHHGTPAKDDNMSKDMEHEKVPGRNLKRRQRRVGEVNSKVYGC